MSDVQRCNANGGPDRATGHLLICRLPKGHIGNHDDGAVTWSDEWLAEQSQRAAARADSRAALSALRARYPQGPLAAHVTGLLARDAASVELREAERARDDAETALNKSIRTTTSRAPLLYALQKAVRDVEAARVRWRAAIDAGDGTDTSTNDEGAKR